MVEMIIIVLMSLGRGGLTLEENFDGKFGFLLKVLSTFILLSFITLLLPTFQGFWSVLGYIAILQIPWIFAPFLGIYTMRIFFKGNTN